MTLARVLENKQLSPGTVRLRIERTSEHIKAGQCFSLGTSDLAINREYSMYSGADDEFVDFLIRVVEDGIVSRRLASCVPGDLVQVSGPFGEFCLSAEDVAQKQFVFISSGTGIAPFHSFVRTFPELDYMLYHGVRFFNETYDEGDYAPERYRSAVSRPGNAAGSTRVTDLLRVSDLAHDAMYYLCGNRSMITDVIQLLREKKIPGGSIFTETFF